MISCDPPNNGKMKEQGQMKRRGYTTGTCAAAAAKAAAWMLLTNTRKKSIHLSWKPTADQLMDVEFPLEDVRSGEGFVSCAVQKDAGDDIDVTDGLKIFARVSFEEVPEAESDPSVQVTSRSSGQDATSAEEESAPSVQVISDCIVQADSSVECAAAEESGSLAQEDTISVFSGLEESLMQGELPVKLQDLENEDGIIPYRWDQVADFFSQDKGSTSPSGRVIAITEGVDFTQDEQQRIDQLFRDLPGKTIEVKRAGIVPSEPMSDRERFLITGGEGIGRVTKPGLDQSPGEAAINSVPRKMIREAVSAVCEICEYEGRLLIEISAPGGEQIAEKTFNPRLGIEGGISILGTTGIVEPMSGRAVSETVRAEVRVKAAASSFLALVPGNTGAAFVNQELLIPPDKTVIMSNYPGDALDEARSAGVKRVLMTGSLGKMIKLAGGIFYTHSRDADSRMDIMIRCALRAGASARVLQELDSCITTEAAVEILREHELLDQVMEIVLERTLSYLHHRVEDLEVQVIILRNSGEVLAFSEEAFEILGKINE